MQKILVIDDDDVLREMIVSTLSEHGFDTLEAENGAVGLRLARTHLPDLIICDVTMSKMDGYATLDALRKDQATAAIPFILISGEASEAGMRMGRKLGADDFLPKPFSGSELLTAVEARLKKKEALLRQAERKLEDLRSNISLALPHELRTPLTGILGFADVLRSEYASLPRSEIGEMARNIHESASRLHRLIENFLIYAQIEVLGADQQKLESLRTNESTKVSEIVETLAQEKAKLAGRSADLVLDLNDATAAISREYLTKILNELLTNAFNFSEPGTPVQASISTNGESLSVSISDSGRGMMAEDITDIGAYMQFERKFYEQQGSGLGLSIAKRLTELHGGTLSIRSEVESGTTVVVKLPKSVQAQD